MNQNIYQIPIVNLLWVFGLVIIVGIIYFKWMLNAKTVVYATFRMVLQLVLIGFALTYIFTHSNVLMIAGILIMMLLAASWIALRPVKEMRIRLFPKALLAIGVGGVLTLVLVIGGVIQLTPWNDPRYLIPIAGMIFANSMNSVSLAAERFQTEIDRQGTYVEARGRALNTALLPLTNSFLAVGLVSLPGMMTGQILAGISPLIAVRYQIMVMCMLFGAAGISSAIYLWLLKSR